MTAASDVIGIDDVFEARIAPSGSAAEHVLLHLGVLDHGLDHQVSLDEVVRRRYARQHLVGRRAALLGKPLEALPHRRHAAFDRAGIRIV